MMTIGNVHRGRTLKSVTVGGIAEDDREHDVVDHAIRAAGETRSSLFGWNVRWHEDCPALATVTLYTD